MSPQGLIWPSQFAWHGTSSIATTAEVDALLNEGAPVAIGVSGGKDSSVVALAVNAHLKAIGHRGPRVLIHADLGVSNGSNPCLLVNGWRTGLDLN